MPTWQTYTGKQPQIYRRSDFFKIMHVAKPPTQQVACLLMMRQGLRAGEVRVLQHRDVEIDYLHPRESVLYLFDSKDKKSYPMKMHRDLIAAYKELESQTGYVLKRHKRYKAYNGPVSYTTLERMVRQWAYDAGVHDWEEFSPTRFRAFFAKEWIRPVLMPNGQVQSGSVPTLSKLMRHHDAFTTWIYLQSIAYVEDLDYESHRLYGAPFAEPVRALCKRK